MSEIRDQIRAVVDAPAPVGVGEILDRGRRGAPAPGGTHHARTAMALVTLVVMVVVASTVIAIGGSSPRRSATHPTTHGGWQLVSDVTGAWQSLSGPAGVFGGLPDVHLQCPSTTTCYVYGVSTDSAQLVDEMDVTTDAGATWSTVTLPATMGPGSRLSCPSATTCDLLGVDASGTPHFFVTTNGGTSWTDSPYPLPIDVHDYVNDLACTSATVCAAVFTATSGNGGTTSWITAGTSTTVAAATSDGGVHWSSSPMTAAPGPDSVRCVAETCVATAFALGYPGDGGILYSHDGGSSWSTASLGAPVALTGSVDCGDAEHCLLVSGDLTPEVTTVQSSTDGGQTWTSEPGTGLPDGNMSSVACVTTTTCWAGGLIPPPHAGSAILVGSGAGYVAETTDLGATWQRATLPDSVHGVFSLSCPTASTCFAVAILKDASGQFSVGLITDAAG